MFRPFDTLRHRVAEARSNDSLFFATLISEKTIESVFGDAKAILDSAQIYTTAVTLWVFLSQVMSINHGCVSAVAKLVSWRAVKGLRPCSAATGAYCIARDKLDESSMQRLLTQSGVAIDAQTPGQWRWKNHQVIVADGATVTMADTPENQKEYPQIGAQNPGCGFPIMRMLVLFALSTGAVLEVALGKYAGKLSHEVSRFGCEPAALTNQLQGDSLCVVGNAANSNCRDEHRSALRNASDLPLLQRQPLKLPTR